MTLIEGEQGGCDIVNALPIEKYLYSLLAKEMHAKWPLEALKAQAVAARSYALHKKLLRASKKEGRFYDLISSEFDQVSGGLFDEKQRTAMAVKATSGEVLMTLKGQFVPIFFHSKCGGKTFRPFQVWQSKIPSYESVECPFCHKLGVSPWATNLKSQDFKLISEKVFKKSKGLEDLRLLKDSIERSHLHFKTKKNQSLLVKKAVLRKILGRRKLLSNRFVITKWQVKNGQKGQVKGLGLGHNVGMCQFGVLELARRGYHYKEILNFYFPHFKLVSLY